jgi:hypothetical protein
MADNFETRPWRHGDLDLLRASESLFEPETYSRRFLAGVRRLRPLHLKVRQQLAAPGLRWMGEVGLDRGHLVALAECAWDPADPDSPTVVLNVADAWQPGPIGRRTVRRLVDRCLEYGLTTLNLDYLASNTSIESLLEPAVTENAYSLSGVTGAGIGHLTVRVAK